MLVYIQITLYCTIFNIILKEYLKSASYNSIYNILLKG